MSVRKFTGDSLVLGTHNWGKVKEIGELFEPLGVNVMSLSEFDIATEPVEDGDSFLDNADIKSRYYAKATGQPTLADDSGLCVNALDGRPGIYSARWAGEQKDFPMAIRRIESELAESGSSDLSAHFVCALSFCWPDGHIEHVEGRVYGQLQFPPVGDEGFGYDPIFVPDGHTVRFSEMDSALKQSISHRADAFKQLIEKCFVSKVAMYGNP